MSDVIERFTIRMKLDRKDDLWRYSNRQEYGDFFVNNEQRKIINDIIKKSISVAFSNADEIHINIGRTRDNRIVYFYPDKVIERYQTSEQKNEEINKRARELIENNQGMAQAFKGLIGEKGAIAEAQRIKSHIRLMIIILFSVFLGGLVWVGPFIYRYFELFLPKYPSWWYILPVLFCVFAVAKNLYHLKKKHLHIYAMLEYAVGFVSAYVALQKVHLDGGLAPWIAICGSVYIFVRASTNMSQADENFIQIKKAVSPKQYYTVEEF